MTSEQEVFVEIGKMLTGGEQSQMFGKPCFKTNGKAFVSFYENEMVFKLTGEMHKKALRVKGARMFDPSEKGRAMKEWVQVPFINELTWSRFAAAALEYVRGTL